MKAIGMMDRRLFNDLWVELLHRTRTSTRSIRDVIQRLEELSTLYGAYSRWCLEPVFDRFPPDLQATVDPRLASELEEVRERIVGYRDELERFVEEVRGQVKQHTMRQLYFSRPKPFVLDGTMAGKQ